MNSTIQHLSSSSFAAATAQGVTLLDFYATWCGPCKALAPTLEALEGEFADRGVRIAKVDVDESPELAARFSVTGVPTLIVLKDGREVRRHVGAAPAGVLRELVS